MSSNINKLADTLLGMEFSYNNGRKEVKTTYGERLKKLLIEQHNLAIAGDEAAALKNKTALDNFYSKFAKDFYSVFKDEFKILSDKTNIKLTESLMKVVIDRAIPNIVKRNSRYFAGSAIAVTLTTFSAVATGMFLGHALTAFPTIFAFLTPLVGPLAPVAAVLVVAALFAATVLVAHLLVTGLTAAVIGKGVMPDEKVEARSVKVAAEAKTNEPCPETTSTPQEKLAAPTRSRLRTATLIQSETDKLRRQKEDDELLSRARARLNKGVDTGCPLKVLLQHAALTTPVGLPVAPPPLQGKKLFPEGQRVQTVITGACNPPTNRA
jgi:hypothetical protein